MEWSTHALSGALAGYLITNDWKGATVGVVAGVVPDLDEHRSKFGKMFFPISFLMNKLFGHRTFTHSLLFVCIVWLVLCIFADVWISFVAAAGILAHILGDMLTGKVKLFYPVDKSIGFRINPIFFQPIDRITRILLLVIGLFFVFQKLMLT